MGFFKSPQFRDPQLGDFSRSHGLWRGAIALDSGQSVPLVLSGTRTGPDEQALALIREVVTRYASWRPIIETALFEHYAPYAEALAAGKFSSEAGALPNISAPDQVWPYVSLVFVAVTPLDGVFTAELGYTTDWDEEHTLGARFRSGKFIELCGSVLPP